MKYSNVRVEDKTKSLLDDLQEKYSYKTYDNCINSLASFIANNDIDPTDKNLGNFKNSLIDVETRISKNIANTQKQLNADNVSLRKWVGAIERDYLVVIKKKLDLVDRFVQFNIENKTVLKMEEAKFENPINANLSSVDNKNIGSDEKQNFYKEILAEREKHEELFLKNEKQRKTLEKIFSKAKIEEGGMLSKEKIIIEMSIEEWEKLK